MHKYKIIVAYDGTEYAGWQVQADQKTVAGTLQDTFKEVFNQEIIIAGASRTDAGVHALGQTAIFSTSLVLDAQQLLFAWQNILPESIAITSIKKVPLDWNPRHAVKQKIYRYHFFQKRPTPFIARYGWHYPYPVNLKKLQQALDIFVGTHDFRSFCTGHEHKNTVRTIDAINVIYVSRLQAYRITVKGPGFLRYMIRRMVGACLEVASRDTILLDDIKRVLAQKNPLHTLPTAPAKGLLLYKILYNFPVRLERT